MNTVAFLGNYAPRCCGIATFTQDLRSAVMQANPRLRAPVAMVSDDPKAYSCPDEVEIVLPEKDRAAYTSVADELNRSGVDAISLQHEYGIYGGPAGAWILDLLKRLDAPVVTTCHTVLRDPSPQQRHVLRGIAHHSARMIVMAEKGREFLQEIYGVPAEKIVVIPHGIPDATVSSTERAVLRQALGWAQRRVMFTFGLVSPSKGIEHAIRALPEIVRHHPDVLYVVTGATHPNLVREQGESYREGLVALAAELGVAEHLQFINRFVSRDELIQLIAAADIYATPYLNEAQITSGTLAYAFGMGKPVISTPYWHASELLASGHGVLVPFRNSEAFAEAAVALFRDDQEREAISQRAWEKGRGMTWGAVGRSYADVFEAAAAARRRPAIVRPVPGTVELPRTGHFEHLMGEHGIFQHAIGTEPDPAHGFCTDDNARALIAITDLMRCGLREGKMESMFNVCFDFLMGACDPRIDRFRNFMDSDGRWLEPWGSEDSHGRALWAMGHVARHFTASPVVREAATHVLRAAAPLTVQFTSPRAWAFTILGLTNYLETVRVDPIAEILRDELASRLARLFYLCAADDWVWFEDRITYDNGKLPQALLAAARQTGNLPWCRIALRALGFLTQGQTAPGGHFRAVGCDGFWRRNQPPAQWDQQPLEAQAMTAACLEAHALTGQAQWLTEAHRAFAWFTGENDHGLPLVDSETGGCCDGLHVSSLNLNQGAESTLAWLQSAAAMHLATRTAAASAPDIAVHPVVTAAA